MKIKRYEPAHMGEMIQSQNGPWVRVEVARELAADIRFLLALVYDGVTGTPTEVARVNGIRAKLAMNTRVKA